MSMKLLGEHFDIHGGGLDLVFPHHENEVAQSESYTGKPFATYWLHNGLLTKGGRKISKSDPDTVVEMRELLDRHEPDTIRALLLSSHYRRPIDYSNERLDEIARGLQSFRNLFDRVERICGQRFYDLHTSERREDAAVAGAPEEVLEHRRRFLEAMDDDFNTGGALGELFEITRVLNRVADSEKLESPDHEASKVASFREGIVALKELAQILGLFRRPPLHDQGGASRDELTAPLLDLLVQLRTRLRKEKNFALADEIRNRLGELGVVLEDRPDGTGWKIEAK